MLMKGKVLAFRWTATLPVRSLLDELKSRSGQITSYWGEKLLIVCDDPAPVPELPLMFGGLISAKSREALTFLVQGADKKKRTCRVDKLDPRNRQCEQCYFAVHRETLIGLSYVYADGPTTGTLCNIVGKIHDELLPQQQQTKEERRFRHELIMKPDDAYELVKTMKDIRAVRVSLGTVGAGALELDSHEANCLKIQTQTFSFFPGRIGGGTISKAIAKLRKTHTDVSSIAIQYAAEHGLETVKLLEPNVETFGKFPVDDFAKEMQLDDVVSDFPGSAILSELRSMAKRHATLLATGAQAGER